MALTLLHIGNKVALGYDDATGERGFLTKIVNGTGSASVKGTLVSVSTTADNKFVLQANEYDTMGIVAEAGIANDAECWIWKNGSTAQVLYKDTVASTRGQICTAADTDGRAIDIVVPVGSPGIDAHFKEIGHVRESKIAGTDVLVLVELHFN